MGGQFAARTYSHFNPFGELTNVEEREGGSPILDFEHYDAVFFYDASGALATAYRKTDPGVWPGEFNNNIRTTYGYDGAGRLKTLAHQDMDSGTSSTYQELVSFGYAYDAANRIGTQSTGWNAALPAFNGRPTFVAPESLTFQYDAAGQLKDAISNIAGQSSTYGYNANGNRGSATEPGGGTDTYASGPQNRVNQDSTYRYEYDYEGNLIERRILGSDVLNQKYFWDHRNRLVKVENFTNGAVDETINYRYEAAGNLAYRSADPAGSPPAVVEHHVVEDGERTMTLDGAGKVVRRYAHGPADQILFDHVFDALGQEIDLRLPLGDHQNSTRGVLAHDGADATYVRQSLDYDPFGRVRAVLGANGLPDTTGLTTAYAFQGMIYDAATGQYQTEARVYSPDLGRFISEDPIQDGSNWYMAFNNNPVLYVDPSGLSPNLHPLSGGGLGLVGSAAALARGASALAPHVIDAFRSPTARTIGNSIQVAASFDARNSVLPAGDPSLGRLFSIAVDPSISVSGGSRARLFEALQFAEADARHGAFQSQGYARLNQLNSFSSRTAQIFSDARDNAAFAERLELGSALTLSGIDQGTLDRKFRSRGLGGVAVVQPNSYGLEYGGLDSVSGLYRLQREVLYPTYAPTGGLGYTPGPVEFVAGGLAVGLRQGVRAGAGAFVEDVVTESTGLPFLPSLRLAPNEKVFSQSRTSFTSTRSNGTGHTYEVIERTDINWNQVRTAGDVRALSLTNAEAAKKYGLAPQLDNGNFGTLHHLGQDARGPLVEANTRYHGVGKPGQGALHSQYGRYQSHPTNPVNRSQFNADTREYWQNRAPGQ